MAKGSYNISSPSDSNSKKEGKNGNENRECLNSCLSPTFLRSLSLHDRPRSSRVPTKKELHKSLYKTLVSSSLEKIPSVPSPPSEEISECSNYRDFESVAINAETEVTRQSSLSPSATHHQTDQNRPSEPDSWSEDRYMRFSVEPEKLLEKAIAILRAVDEDISESLTDLTKPESITLECVMEIYRNKGKNTVYCSASSELDLSTVSSSEPIYENWQPSIQKRPKDVQTHSSPLKPNGLRAQSTQQSPKTVQVQPSSSQSIYENWQPFVQEMPKHLQAHSTPRQSPKNLKAQSALLSPKTVHIQSSQQSPKNANTSSTQQNPKNLLIHSVQETLKNFESLSSNSGNTHSLIDIDSDDLQSVEKKPKNLPSAPTISATNDRSKVKSLMEFQLPSDHEQFIKIIEALQNRCLEYREMIQDIAVSALEECLNFSDLSSSRIRNLRRQFQSQKRNFGDFKELCCKSVVFGPDSLPINEKVTEVIQSFYLKLLQEENETFIVRLEFGLKMSEVYSKMLKLETESKKIITTLEKEILYLKKTSVGFKV